MEFFTIGVYNSREEEFFGKLTENGIDKFVDIRQRRGVRGSLYSFANSTRLQAKLQELKISYEHIIELAPTSEIRSAQEKTDKQQKKRRRERTQLSDFFIHAYKEQVLSQYNLNDFLKKLKKKGFKKIVLFCVEEIPEACHRSLVSKKLETLGYKVSHL